MAEDQSVQSDQSCLKSQLNASAENVRVSVSADIDISNPLHD